MMQISDKAPAMNLSLSDGSSLDLSEPGGPVVLYFYPNDRNGSDRAFTICA